MCFSDKYYVEHTVHRGEKTLSNDNRPHLHPLRHTECVYMDLIICRKSELISHLFTLCYMHLGHRIMRKLQVYMSNQTYALQPVSKLTE